MEFKVGDRVLITTGGGTVLRVETADGAQWVTWKDENEPSGAPRYTRATDLIRIPAELPVFVEKEEHERVVAERDQAREQLAKATRATPLGPATVELEWTDAGIIEFSVLPGGRLVVVVEGSGFFGATYAKRTLFRRQSFASVELAKRAAVQALCDHLDQVNAALGRCPTERAPAPFEPEVTVGSRWRLKGRTDGAYVVVQSVTAEHVESEWSALIGTCSEPTRLSRALFLRVYEPEDRTGDGEPIIRQHPPVAVPYGEHAANLPGPLTEGQQESISQALAYAYLLGQESAKQAVRDALGARRGYPGEERE